jgi:hypothetical protein
VFVDIKRQCRNASTSNHPYRNTQHTKSAHDYFFRLSRLQVVFGLSAKVKKPPAKPM